jgi:hypothetical protein
MSPYYYYCIHRKSMIDDLERQGITIKIFAEFFFSKKCRENFPKVFQDNIII